MAIWTWVTSTASTDIGKVLLGFALGLITLIISQVLAIWKESAIDKGKRKRKARFLALRLVLLLDDFVGDCYNAAMNNEPEINPHDEMDFRFRYPAPTLTLPEDADWEAFDPHLTDDVLRLENRLRNIRAAHSSLDATPPDYDDLFEHRGLDYSKLGMTTLGIVSRLCRRYKIKPPERPQYYDPEEGFTRQIKKIEEYFEVQAENQRLLWERYEEDRRERMGKASETEKAK